MLNRVWLTPPLAFARVGPSSTPCAAFQWAASDLSPRGSSYTTLVPVETLELASDGTVSHTFPERIIFIDAEGIRPVAPFFELWGEWTTPEGNTACGPITTEVLSAVGASVADITWRVHVAALKPFHYTYQPGDRIEAQLELRGNQTSRTDLLGMSPLGAGVPLVPTGTSIPMGAVQIAIPAGDFTEIRLRFYPPAGHIYGPRNLKERIAALDLAADGNAEWRGFTLPDERLLLDATSSWATYSVDLATLPPLGRLDYRNAPGGLLAAVVERLEPGGPLVSRSLGLVDDVSDGVIQCRLAISGKEMTAWARIVVGPPDFAPGNRTPVSLADGLADREDRATPRSANWTKEELGELVADMLERAFETSDLLHKDYQNYRSTNTNRNEFAANRSTSMLERDDVQALLWPVPLADTVATGRAPALELSETGNRKHRRYAALEYLEDRFRENPELLNVWLRRPLDPSPYFDKRMPALMRGSDGRPFHLTRRQWEIFRTWIDLLRAAAPSAGPSAPGR